jgi:hypothetical protein
MKIRPLGAELLHAADGKTDITKLSVAFRNFVKATKSKSVKKVLGSNRCLYRKPYKTHN